MMVDLRDTETGDPARLPAHCPGSGRCGLVSEKMWHEKNNILHTVYCTGLTRAAKAGQISILQAQRAQRTNQGRGPFTLRVPICLSFNSQQGPPLSGLSGWPFGGIIFWLFYEMKFRCVKLFSLSMQTLQEPRVQFNLSILRHSGNWRDCSWSNFE